jgi:hypothetical protein
MIAARVAAQIILAVIGILAAALFFFMNGKDR